MRLLKQFRPYTLAASLLFALVLPVQATLEENLSPFPDDVLAMVSISLDPTDWPYLLSKIDKELNQGFLSDAGRSKKSLKLPAEVGPILQILDSELKFDPLFDGLQSLGSHLSLAWRASKSTQGYLLFSLNLRSPDRIQSLLTQLKNRPPDAGKALYQFKTYGGQDYFSYDLPAANGQSTGEQLLLTVSGQNLIGTLGPDSQELERMLFIQSDLTQDSRFRLVTDSGFKSVRETFSDKPLWAYLNLRRGLQHFYQELLGFTQAFTQSDDSFSQGNDSQLQTDRWAVMLEQIANLNHSAGLGLELHPDGLRIQTLILPDHAKLTDQQRDFLAVSQSRPEHSLGELTTRLPQAPLQFYGGQNLHQLLNHPLPFDPVDPDWQARALPEQITEMSRYFAIDLQRDLLPLLDGRYGVGVYLMPSLKSAGLPTEEHVLYFGVKSGQGPALDELLTKRLELSADWLEQLDEPVASTTGAFIYNLNALNDALKLYAQRFGGLYPATLDALMRASETPDDAIAALSHSQHPLTQLAQPAYQPRSEFTQPPELSLRGTVFFAPAGAAVTVKGQTRNRGFELLGYGPDGVLYRLRPEDSEPVAVRQGLPVPPRLATLDRHAQLLETTDSTPIYRLPLPLQQYDRQTLYPVFARKGDLLLVAFQPELLRAALEDKAVGKMGNWLAATAGPEASGVFYFDYFQHRQRNQAAQAEVLSRNQADFGPNAYQYVDEIDDAIKALLTPWRRLYVAIRPESGGTRHDLFFELDSNALRLSDPTALIKLFEVLQNRNKAS